MKIGDLVKYRSPGLVGDAGCGFDSWLGIIIEALPGHAGYKKVRWVNTDNGKLETVSHKAKDLFKLNENR
jgi:hypothetical protein